MPNNNDTGAAPDTVATRHTPEAEPSTESLPVATPPTVRKDPDGVYRVDGSPDPGPILDALARAEVPPVTPGENGCDCYGQFSRTHNPSRGCPVHGVKPDPAPVLDALTGVEVPIVDMPESVTYRVKDLIRQLSIFDPELEVWIGSAGSAVPVDHVSVQADGDEQYVYIGSYVASYEGLRPSAEFLREQYAALCALRDKYGAKLGVAGTEVIMGTTDGPMPSLCWAPFAVRWISVEQLAKMPRPGKGEDPTFAVVSAKDHDLARLAFWEHAPQADEHGPSRDRPVVILQAIQ